MARTWLKKQTVKQMTETQAAWVAGFFDGEGTLGKYSGGRGGKYLSWVVTIPNTDLGSLEFIREVLGGNISRKPVPKVSHHKQQYVLKISSQRDIKSFCEQVLPYVITKREVVQNFLSGWKDIE